MRRLSAAIVAALLAVGLFAPAAFAAAPAAAAAKAVPQRRLHRRPGRRRHERLPSAGPRRGRDRPPATPRTSSSSTRPNATWPAVQDALQGASLVVYMGHGNGWPSKYRDELYPPTQNGFGLNPTAGGGDSTHQYFGEASSAEQVKLAKNADRPAQPPVLRQRQLRAGAAGGQRSTRRSQRVDNYAAGFIQAGAAAVIAEAWSSPSYFVRAILGGGRSIQSAWSDEPRARTATGSRSRASAAPATSPRWTPRPRRPGSRGRSS